MPAERTLLQPYPRMIDSGVSWLGKIPEHWSTARSRFLLREVDVRSEGGTETHLSMSQSLGLVTSSEVDNSTLVSESYAGGKLVQADDLVLNRLKAHLGVFARATQTGVISPDYTVLRARRPLAVRYYEEALRSPACRQELYTRTKGIVEGFWRLYTDDFYDVRLPEPPVPEQEAIVRFLSYADRQVRRYIRAKQRLIKLLEEQTEVIVHRAVTRGVDPTVSRKPSGVEWLGEMPEHWEVVPSRAMFKHRREKARRDEEILTASQSYGIVSRSEFMAREGRRVMEVLTGYDILKHVEPDDFVMSMRSFEGGLEWSQSRGAISSAYVMLVPNEDVHAPYFARLLKTRAYISALRRTSDLVRDGQALRYANFVQIPLPRVPIEEQRAIASFLDKVLAEAVAKVHRLQSEVSLLREYRTRLIADVVTGKLDVREWAARSPGEIEEAEDIDQADAIEHADAELGDDPEPEEVGA